MNRNLLTAREQNYKGSLCYQSKLNPHRYTVIVCKTQLTIPLK